MAEKFAAFAIMLVLIFGLSALPSCSIAKQESPQEKTEPAEKPETQKDPKPAAPDAKPASEQDEKPKADKKDKSTESTTKASAGDWPLFRGNSKSTGVAKSKLPDKLDILWKHEVKKGAFESAPVVIESDGKRTVYIGDLDGTLLALDLETGKPAWKFKSASVRESEAKGLSLIHI